MITLNTMKEINDKAYDYAACMTDIVVTDIESMKAYEDDIKRLKLEYVYQYGDQNQLSDDEFETLWDYVQNQ